VLANLRRLRQEHPDSLLRVSIPEQAAAWRAFDQAADTRLAHLAVMALFLRHQALGLLSALRARQLPAILIKGPLFAQRLYHPAALRTYIDVDLLVPRSAWDAIQAGMTALNFRPHDVSMKYAAGYGEQAWTHPDHPGCSFEVHWNLVNSPTLRRGMSVSYEDLRVRDDPDPLGASLAPAALLLLATVHAAASHSFDKLQHLCDIAQIARGAAGPVDASALDEMTTACGARLAVATGLHLAGEALGEPSCGELCRQLEGRPRRSLIGRLITVRTVVRAQRPSLLGSARRRLFRQLLKQG
jgi:hypothetical protein